MKFEISRVRKGKKIELSAEELIGMLEDSDSISDWEVKQIRPQGNYYQCPDCDFTAEWSGEIVSSTKDDPTQHSCREM